MKKIFTVLLSFILYMSLYSQVVIPDNAQIEPSAELKVYSTNKGVLIPRLTTLDLYGISSPATGLWVYNTTKKEFFYYNSTAWKTMTVTPTAAVDPATGNFEGKFYFNTTDNKLHYYDGSAWVIVGTL